ncbi:MAG: SMP-30/gluconolactonase/LRE family protein [Planctomycetes bacterium]|nr:SMP-30/gluconolactonase/LRE family protein [Planctomycetota bacterium]
MIYLACTALALALQTTSGAPPKLGAFLEQIELVADRSFVVFDAAGRPATAVADARCPSPASVVFARNGDTYFTDPFTDSVHRRRAGTTEDLATFGGRGLLPGELCGPQGLTLDPRGDGRVIVADTLNHRVSVFDVEGRGLATFGRRGFGDAELNHPLDVAVDATGAVFVADTGNDRIVKFDAAGKFMKSFGGRGSYPGLFRYPTGLDVHGERVYVADRDNHRIQVFDLSGEFVYEWGVHALLPREGQGKLHDPSDVAISADGRRAAVIEPMENRIQVFGVAADDTLLVSPERDSAVHYGGFPSARGDLFAVADPTGPSVSIFDLTRGTPIEITRFGRPGHGPGRMLRPTSVLLDEKAEHVYVADGFASTISKYRIARKPDEVLRFDPFLAQFVASIDLTRPSAVSLRWPTEPEGMCLGRNGEILVADSTNRRVITLSAALVPLRDSGEALRGIPRGIAYRAADASVCVSTSTPDAVSSPVSAPGVRVLATGIGLGLTQGDRFWHVFADGLRQGSLTWFSDEPLATPGIGRGEFWHPEGLAIDAQGRIFVVDTGNHRFQILDAEGQYLDMFGARFYTEAARTPPPPMPAAQAWDGAKTVTTNASSWRIAWRVKPNPIPRGETFVLDAWVFAPGHPHTPVKDVALSIDGWMPEHLHGMNRVPRVARRDDGGFTFEGVYLHMSGFWELAFDVTTKGLTERATVRVDLE